ncbi:hypothetical protein [Streptomyces mirabilis]|uniref:hypothetical protein n=1 Tax=Streptomyces mirabilis TaxID=68239 RepID=UPI0036EC5084
MAVECDSDIDGSTLSTSTFAVTDRTVTKVYTNRTAGLAQRGKAGGYVVVELSPDDTAAALWVTQQGPGTPPGGAGRGAGPATTAAAQGRAGGRRHHTGRNHRRGQGHADPAGIAYTIPGICDWIMRQSR